MIRTHNIRWRHGTRNDGRCTSSRRTRWNAHGARVGEHDAGPVGAIVGGVVGGVIGGVNGVLGIEDRPRFHAYVAERHYPSYEYRDEVRVGAVLPDEGVTYCEVPPEYSSAREYRYTIVNGHTVLVDARTHRIVQIID